MKLVSVVEVGSATDSVLQNLVLAVCNSPERQNSALSKQIVIPRTTNGHLRAIRTPRCSNAAHYVSFA